MNQDAVPESASTAIPRGYTRNHDRSPTVIPFDFGAVVDDVHPSNLEAFDIGDYTFGPAEASEVDRLQPMLQNYMSDSGRNRFPLAQMMVGDENGVSRDVDRSEWRFCVVRPKSANSIPAYKIEQALRISDADQMVPHGGPTHGTVHSFSR